METIYARAKINLTLYVTGRRENGYHDLELIFQPVSLSDTLRIRENETGDLIFTCSVQAFANESNLVCRGYRTLKERFPDQVGGLTIHLIKNIPSGAGMGGGSTDCSALLVWMNRKYDLGLTREELIEIGAGLGADVPACMFSHATLGRGIGEQLTDIRMERDYPLLLIKPEMSFSTGEMYARVDSLPPESGARVTESVIRAMESGDLAGVAGGLYNVFEQAIPEPEKIAALKEELLSSGALGSLMTGSGSVVYGIYDSDEARDAAYERLAGKLPDCRVICCEAVNHWEPEAEYSFL